jgi:hypothetical protein
VKHTKNESLELGENGVIVNITLCTQTQSIIAVGTLHSPRRLFLIISSKIPKRAVGTGRGENTKEVTAFSETIKRQFEFTERRMNCFSAPFQMD